METGHQKAVNFTKTGKPTTHGTTNTYKRHGCRCEPCTEAHRENKREWYRGLSPNRKAEIVQGVTERAERIKQEYYSELVRDLLVDLGVKHRVADDDTMELLRTFVGNWNGSRHLLRKQETEGTVEESREGEIE